MHRVLRAMPEPVRRLLGGIVSSTGDDARSKRGAILAFAIRVASAGILFLSQVILARWLGTYEYGVYTYVWVWTTVVGTMCCLGFATTVVRFVPEYTERGEYDKARGFLRAARTISAATGVGAMLLGLLALEVLDGWYDPGYKIPLTYALLALPAFAVTDYQDGVGRAHSWLALALVPPYILRPVLLFMFVGIAVATGWAHNAETAAFALLLATWLTVFVQYALQKRRILRRMPAGPRRYDVRFWLIVSMPVLLLEGFTLVMMNMDVLLLELYVSADQIGIYYATARTITLISFVHFAVTAAVMPRFSTYFAAGDTRGLTTLLAQSRLWTLVPSLAGAAVLLLLGKPLLWLFGSDFTAGYPLMFVLAAGLVARAAVGPTQALLVVTGHQNTAAIVLSGAVVANIALNFTLIPQYGVMGAAWATSLAYGLEALAFYLWAKRIYRPSPGGETKGLSHVSPAE